MDLFLEDPAEMKKASSLNPISVKLGAGDIQGAFHSTSTFVAVHVRFTPSINHGAADVRSAAAAMVRGTSAAGALAAALVSAALVEERSQIEHVAGCWWISER